MPRRQEELLLRTQKLTEELCSKCQKLKGQEVRLGAKSDLQLAWGVIRQALQRRCEEKVSDT